LADARATLAHTGIGPYRGRMTVRIGIDLGGTKIEGLALSGDGARLRSERIDTPRDDYGATLDAVVALAARLGHGLGDATVGIGHPGVVSPASGVIKNANSTWLNGRALAADLEARLGGPVRCANDANCFALSEAVDGAGAGAGVVFGVILGTGTGGGIVVRGEVLTGANAIAGEWGHNPLPWMQQGETQGTLCWCGRHGCIETFLSGPALARDHRELGGADLDARAIAELADTGDGPARATLARWAGRLGRALAGVINALDPDVIVLGGGLSQLHAAYAALDLARPYVFTGTDALRTRLLPPRHGDASGARGAAWLWGR